MTPQKIKYLLSLKNISQRQLADQLSVSTAAISRTIKGGLVSAEIQSAIADAIKQPTESVFPIKKAA